LPFSCGYLLAVNISLLLALPVSRLDNKISHFTPPGEIWSQRHFVMASTIEQPQFLSGRERFVEPLSVAHRDDFVVLGQNDRNIAGVSPQVVDNQLFLYSWP